MKHFNKSLLNDTAFVALTLSHLATNTNIPSAPLIREAFKQVGISTDDPYRLAEHLLKNSLEERSSSGLAGLDLTSMFSKLQHQLRHTVATLSGLDLNDRQAVTHSAFFFPIYLSTLHQSSPFSMDLFQNDVDTLKDTLGQQIISDFEMIASKNDLSITADETTASRAKAITLLALPATMDPTKCYPDALLEWKNRTEATHVVYVVTDTTPERAQGLSELTPRELKLRNMASELVFFSQKYDALNYKFMVMPHDDDEILTITLTSAQLGAVSVEPTAQFAAFKRELKEADLSGIPKNMYLLLVEHFAEKHQITLPTDTREFLDQHAGLHASLDLALMDAVKHTCGIKAFEPRESPKSQAKPLETTAELSIAAQAPQNTPKIR